MKNIISQKKFKELYIDKKINDNILFKDRLNESMDFSNNTGFSTSLIGRIINKTFSFAAKYVDYAKLSKFGDEFRNELEKALLYASSVINISDNQTTTATTTKTTTKTKTTNTDDDIFNIVYNVVVYIIFMSISHGRYLPSIAIKTLKLNKKQQENLKDIYDVVKINELHKLDKISKNETIDNISDNMSDITDIIMFKKSNNMEENIKTQIMSIKSVVNKINPSELSETDMKAIPIIIKKLEEEKKILKSDDNKKTIDLLLNKLKEIIKNKEVKNLTEEELKSKLNDYVVFLDNYKNTIIKILENYFKKISIWYNKEVDGKKINYKYKNLYRELVVMLHPDKIKNNTVLQNIQNLQKVKEILKRENIILETINIKKYLSDYMIFEATDLVKVTSTDLNTNDNNKNINDDEIKSKITDLIITFSKEQKEEILNYFNNRKQETINDFDIKINNSDKQEVKDFIKNIKKNTTTTNNSSINKNDENNYICKNKARGALKSLDSKEKISKFIQLAINSVNSEKLKVIALKAEMLYNKENYKSAKSEIYSRVNFSKTHPDQEKIKNKWLKIISTVKAEYMWCFSINGTWPNSIDPIGLMNSDVNLRKNFNEYNSNAKKILKDNGGIYEDDVVDEKTLKHLRLLDGMNINANNKLMLIVFNNDNSKIGLVVRSQKISNFMTYSIYGYILYDELISKLKNKYPNYNNMNNLIDINEIKNIINNVHIKKISDIDNIKSGVKDRIKKQFTILANNQILKNNILIRDNVNNLKANKFFMTYDNNQLKIIKIKKDNTNMYFFDSLSSDFDNVISYKTPLSIDNVYGISDIKAWNNIIVKNNRQYIINEIKNHKDKIDILIKK